MLDLNQIAYFVQVVQSGSFAQASRRLALPPATLSRQIASLEDALGARLLQRTTRKLSLTDAGRNLYDQSVSQVEAILAAADALSGDRQTPRGTIRIAANAGFFDLFQMGWVADFLERYPAVRLEFVLSDTLVDLVGEGIDVAFRGSADMPDSSLVARKLASGTLVLVASPAYLAARGTPRSLTDLSAHDCIRAVHAKGPVPWRLVGAEGPRQVTVTGRFSANTGRAQREAAMAGLGISLLPRNMVEDGLRSGQLLEVLPGVVSSPGALYAVYPSRRHVPRAVLAFVDMAVQRMALWAPEVGASPAGAQTGSA